MFESIDLHKIISQTIMITTFVMVMMMVIEFLNVKSRGDWAHRLKKSPFLQILLAAVMGLIPGCLGAYTIVSLYAHEIFRFSALVTAMIATSGDEAFVMFSVIPKYALILNAIVFVIAVSVGVFLMYFGKRFEFFCVKPDHMVIHEHEAEVSQTKSVSIIDNLKNISFIRALLIGGLLLFLFGMFTGVFHHDHFDIATLTGAQPHQHEGEHHINWVKITYIVVSSLAMYIFLKSSDHFLEDHLWGHVIKKHFIKILSWTFFAMLLVAFMAQFYEVNDWISDNLWMVLILAVIIGVIPESGPHLVFVILFFQGLIPFSILLASSIVQDGHGALPLLAESRKSFFTMKAINVAVGFVAGAIGLLIGF
ncbi:MAG: arsenic efflux protein [Bacteroidales bacterium]|nr:arsenic efflux protein [Bacteroidales bacterium]